MGAAASPLALALALLLALGCATPAAARVRLHYIAVEQRLWDYAPTGRDLLSGEPFPSGGSTDMDMDMDMDMKKDAGRRRRDMGGMMAMMHHGAATWVTPSKTRIGRKYYKAQYIEYTDDTYTTVRERAERWEHLGALGPVIHAEVGDTIRVQVRNRMDFPVSLHAHGVLYDKMNEGAVYDDGSTAGDAIPPHGRYTYVWTVPKSAGPGPTDGSSVAWPYHSHVNEPRDTNTGLLGMIIVTAKGKARADGSPKDIDREFVVGYYNADESMSWLHERNIQAFLNKSGTLTAEGKAAILSDPGYGQSNLMHCINGYVYANLPGLIAYEGERIRWYLMVLGNQDDMHTPHWHGNTLVAQGRRIDVLQLLPADVQEADMIAYNVGKWMFHCHVNHHIHGGMTAMYTVLPQPLDSLTRSHAGDSSQTKARAGLFFGLLFAAGAAYGAVVVWRRRRVSGKAHSTPQKLMA